MHELACFVAFEPFFWKCKVLNLWCFFSPNCLSNFYVVIRMYKIHVFDEAFFFLATVAMVTENETFSSFHSKLCNRNKFFHHNHPAYQSQLSLKDRVKQIKTPKKCLIKCLFSTPFLRTQTLKMRLKCRKNYFLRFYYHLSYTWVDLIC